MNNLIGKIHKLFAFTKRTIRALMIVAFLSILPLGLTIYLINTPIDYSTDDLAIINQYLVNSRTLKIHKIGCSAINKMSEKNKQLVNDSINSLVSKGYIVCNKCHAGIKRKNEFAVKTIELIDNVIFGDDMIDLPSKDIYLKSIDDLGEWYVNNIATYQTIPDNCANISAIENYGKVNDKIDNIGNIYCYPCSYIEKCEGGYNKAGDDCVRFMFSCLNNANPRFVKTLSKHSKRKWSNINSKIFATENSSIQYSMQKLGFEIYDAKYQTIDLNNDNYYEGIIKQIDSSFRLQKGDILSRDGHIHIYLSDNENFGWGKVNNAYPQRSPTYVNYANNIIVCNGEVFTRVYRYIGDEE